MDDEGRRRALRTVLQGVDGLVRMIHERYAADRDDATRLTQLSVAALAGTMTAVALIAQVGPPIGAGPALLIALGVLGRLAGVVVLATSYTEGRQEDGLGLGMLPGRYVRILDGARGSEGAVLDALVRDKARLVAQNAMSLVERRRRRDLGLLLMLWSSGVVLSGIGLIVGGGFLA